jgi:WhiB family redox-sensing transcriptional regulator
VQVELDLESSDWKLQGECTKYPWGTMFPDPGDTDVIATAKAVCNACPVRVDCLTWAIEKHEYYGVWGGETEEERKEMRRETKPGMLRKMTKEAVGA